MSSFLRSTKQMADMLKGGKNGYFLGSFLPILAMKQSITKPRDAFTKVPLLAHFDPAKLTSLETNASGFAIIGIILQQQDVVCGRVENVSIRKSFKSL
jgi:hypothetical protein